METKLTAMVGVHSECGLNKIITVWELKCIWRSYEHGMIAENQNPEVFDLQKTEIRNFFAVTTGLYDLQMHYTERFG